MFLEQALKFRQLISTQDRLRSSHGLLIELLSLRKKPVHVRFAEIVLQASKVERAWIIVIDGELESLPLIEHRGDELFLLFRRQRLAGIGKLRTKRADADALRIRALVPV